MGVVDEAVEDRVGVGRVADDLVPGGDRQLAGDDGGAATVALFENLEQVVPRERVERLETPVIENEELDAAERALEPGVATIAPGEREAGEELGDALVQDGAVVAAGLVAERAGEPAFADTGRTGDDQTVVPRDPVAGDELHEQGAVETPLASVVDIFRRRLVTKLGEA